MPGYTRRQLKEDKFAETAKGAAHWADVHRQTVIWGGLLVLIVALALGGLWTWHSRQTEQANLELGSALRTFKAQLRPPGAPPDDTAPSFATIAERGKAAEKQFKSIADKFPYTSPGKIAGYLQGVAAMQAGENAAAEQQLKTAADFRDKDIAALAKIALATLYRSTNRSADAVKIYKDLMDHPTATVSKMQAQLELAEIYETTDPQQAKSIYEQLKKDDPTGPAGQIAGAKLNKANTAN